MKKAKAPAPTAEENLLRKRQTEELARLDDEENTRMKRLVRGRLGASSLLGRRSSGRASQNGAAPADTGSGRGGMVEWNHASWGSER